MNSSTQTAIEEMLKLELPEINVEVIIEKLVRILEKECPGCRQQKTEQGTCGCYNLD